MQTTLLRKTFVMLVMSLATFGCNRTDAAAPGGAVEAAADDQSLVGTWEGGMGDAGGAYVVILEVHADGTYKKTLQAKVGSSGYGGTHSGTWKAKGKVLFLSGDGNWPPYSHDLSEFRKVK